VFTSNKSPEENQIYSVRLLEEVFDDLFELRDFYLETIDLESAWRFEGAFWEVVKSLGFWPNNHPIWNGKENVRRINMANHKVSIIFTVDEKEYRVIAVKAFHALRDPKEIDELVEQRIGLKLSKWNRTNPL